MPSPKALILQGILGVAGLCASGAGGIGLGLGKAFGEVQSDAPAANIRDEPVNDQQNTGEVNVDLGIPKECERTCSLTAEQLKKLKFEQKGDEKIKFEDLDDSDEFELIIEESSDSANYPWGKKYTLKPKTIAGTVTIKNIEEGDIVLGKDQEVLIREVIGGGKLEHLLEEVTELGIPKRCKADEVTAAETKTCDLTQHQLQKFNFETRDSEKITVEGLNEGNLVTLKIEDKGDDRNNYPKGKKYILTSTTGPVTIKGVKEGDIVLESGKEVLIRETSTGGKLEHIIEEVDRLGIPKRCNADEVTGGTKTECQLTQKQLKVLKFEAKEGSSITVEGQDGNSKFILEIEDKPSDTENYPRGKKYTIRSTGTRATIRGVKEGDIIVWENQSVVVVRETEEGGKLERAPEEVDDLGIPRNCENSCQLTEHQIKKLQFEVGDGGITVEGINKAKTVELKVEDKSNDLINYPKGKKYTLSARPAVTIKGLKEGDIEIGREGAVVIREKETGGKLEKAPEEIDELGIPRSCSSRCQLTKEQFEKLKFEARPGTSISIEGLNDGKKVELKIETTNDITYYPKWKKYTLKSTSGQVTIRNAKDKDIVLEENKGVVFRATKDGNKLETYLNVLGIPRDWGGENIKKGSEPETYLLSSDQVKDLRFKAFDGESGDVKIEGLNVRDKIKLTISWSDDVNKYPDNKKYSFDNTEKDKKDIKITKGEGEVTIWKNKETWFGNKEGKLEFAEAKDKGQIEIEKKIEEKKEILKELGLEKLQIGNFTGDDAKNPTKHSQTNFEFKNAEDLKKIQFKELGGGADSVTSLGPWGIRVYLDWDTNESKFPKNMKITFENQYFSFSGFKFMKGHRSSVVIFVKDATNYNSKNTFKVEKDKGKWYLVRVNN